ncbi:MAG: sugar phosphate isomerase/epimerase family protein [Clostridia bacterium]
MKIGVNQFCFPCSYDVESMLKAAKKLAFDSVEVCLTAANGCGSASCATVSDALDISGYHNRLLNVASTKQDILLLRQMADDIGMPIRSVGGIVSFSIYPMTSEEPAIASQCMDAVKKMLDAAQLLGADTVLVIPGLLTAHMRYERAYELTQKRLAELADYAPDVMLAVENVWNHMLYSPMEMGRFVDETCRKNIGVYFDIANARRFGYPEQWIRYLGKRIKRFHCKDYRMSIDNINAFTNLLDGDVNYPEVIKAIREIDYHNELVVELVPPARHLVESTLVYARQTLLELLS